MIAKEIDLIREYRTRLIAEVVTGKLDVRNHPDAAEWTPGEQADEPVAFDDAEEPLSDREVEEDDDAVAD